MAQTQDTQTSEPSEDLIAGRNSRPHSGTRFSYPHPENPRPYSKDSQIMVFGIHGTENGPENVRQLTHTVADTLRASRRGNPVEVDTFFNWRDEAGLFNQPKDRGEVAKRFADYVIDNIEEKFKSGEFVKGKPLIIDLVGFSHGGNVGIQAAPEISERLKELSRKYGVNADIHLTTASTPAYYDGNNIEDPKSRAMASYAAQSPTRTIRNRRRASPAISIYRRSARTTASRTTVRRRTSSPI
jgi:hypothetical protein